MRREGLYFGTDIETQRGVLVPTRLFQTHLHVLGPPGAGKTRLLLWLFQLLCRIPKATVILINPKGDLGRQCRDWVIGHGLTKRLTWFDPGDQDHILGWSLLQPNGLPVATHAKQVREGIRASWGQPSVPTYVRHRPP